MHIHTRIHMRTHTHTRMHLNDPILLSHPCLVSTTHCRSVMLWLSRRENVYEPQSSIFGGTFHICALWSVWLHGTCATLWPAVKASLHSLLWLPQGGLGKATDSTLISLIISTCIYMVKLGCKIYLSTLFVTQCPLLNYSEYACGMVYMCNIPAITCYHMSDVFIPCLPMILLSCMLSCRRCCPSPPSLLHLGRKCAVSNYPTCQ